MGAPKRKVLATAEETLVPPDELPEGQLIARVIKGTGNNLYSVELPSKTTILVLLPPRFRSTFWMKRGSYVVVDTKTVEGRESKLGGEIVNVVMDEKAWRKAPFWPKEFVKQTFLPSDDEDEEESTVGKMPPSDEEDE